MEFKSGWNLPPGLMSIPEEKERVYDPECVLCHGEGEYQSLDTLKYVNCDCWESYDPGDCDPRHEYTGED